MCSSVRHMFLCPSLWTGPNNVPIYINISKCPLMVYRPTHIQYTHISAFHWLHFFLTLLLTILHSLYPSCQAFTHNGNSILLLPYCYFSHADIFGSYPSSWHTDFLSCVLSRHARDPLASLADALSLPFISVARSGSILYQTSLFTHCIRLIAPEPTVNKTVAYIMIVSVAFAGF